MDVIMRNEIVNLQLTTLSAGVDTEIPFDQKDDQTILVLANSGTSAVDVTIKAGNGLQGVNDLTVSVKAGANVIKLESGRFKFVSGEHKGNILVNAAAANVSYGIVAMI